MSNYKPFAFILMPFSNQFKDIYELGIKAVATDHEVVAERVDEQYFEESILERVYRQIENSDFVIAEMTGKNPNVFYEVGYAHAKGKLCALITQSVEDIPFDLKHHRHIVYDGSIIDLKEKLGPEIEWMKKESEKKKSSTINATCDIGNEILKVSDYRHTGSFDLKVSLRNSSQKRSPEIEAIYIITSKKWTLKIKGSECPSEDVGQGKLKRSLITPSINRLSPNAFSQEVIQFSRQFWSKWSGEEKKEEYDSTGNIKIEVATSEGSLSFEFPISVTFDDIPF